MWNQFCYFFYFLFTLFNEYLSYELLKRRTLLYNEIGCVKIVKQA